MKLEDFLENQDVILITASSNDEINDGIMVDPIPRKRFEKEVNPTINDEEIDIKAYLQYVIQEREKEAEKKHACKNELEKEVHDNLKQNAKLKKEITKLKKQVTTLQGQSILSIIKDRLGKFIKKKHPQNIQ